MPADQLQRVFEPLFTTKARGIGLGLSVSQSLVVANGGSVSARSEPGAGATFSVFLPVDNS
jgi:signal transduction histidine kinase